MTNDTLKKMGKKQKDFLEILEKNLGMVATACKKYTITRNTHYEWCKTYEGYKEAVNGINERLIDFSESKLYENIRSGDPSSIFFHLKCKAKHRGYVERQEVEHSGNLDIEINIIGEEDED